MRPQLKNTYFQCTNIHPLVPPAGVVGASQIFSILILNDINILPLMCSTSVSHAGASDALALFGGHHGQHLHLFRQGNILYRRRRLTALSIGMGRLQLSLRTLRCGWISGRFGWYFWDQGERDMSKGVRSTDAFKQGAVA